MAASIPRPTSTELSYADRERLVHLAEQGWSRSTIAAEVGCSVRTVQRWLARYRAGGLAALAYRSRRPHHAHPRATPAALVARIDAIRRAHPGWGARLIRRQLQVEGWAGIPSEVTIQHWLRRLGHARLQPRQHPAVSWSTPTAPPTDGVWQMDFKEKGGSGTPVSSSGSGREPVC